MRIIRFGAFCIALIWAAPGLALPAAATINITESTNAAALASAIIGSDAVLTGTPVLNVGTSTNSSSTFTTTGSNLGLASGIILSTNKAKDVIERWSGYSGSGISNSATDERNIATLTLSFTPKAGVNTLSFSSVFTSSDYMCCTPNRNNFTIMLSGGSYNDVNVATIPGTTTKISPITLNKDTNGSYFRVNTATPKPIPDVWYNAVSTVLTHSFTVVPGTTYTATIRIAMAQDTSQPAHVFVGVIAQSTARIQLDLSNAGQGTGYTTTWNSPSPAVAIAGADAVIAGENIPHGIASLSSATITLNNPATGDLLSVTGTLPTGITASAYAPATGVITLSGMATYAAYQTALRQVVYSGTATTTGPTRTANVTVYYVALISNTATATINIARLDIAKTYTLPTAANGAVRLGDVITYSYVITNMGSVAMSNVGVQDMHGSPAVQVPSGTAGITNETLTTPGPAGAAASTNTTPNDGIWNVLAPGAAVTFTWPHTVTQAEVDRG